MFKDSAEKTDLEILQERAEVLGRAGERLSGALKILKGIDAVIQEKLNSFFEQTQGGRRSISRKDQPEKRSQKEFLREINGEIKRYNEAREYAKLRLYYLIVTREAVGFRRHKPVEEQYPIPPKKKLLKRLSWTDIKNKD